MLENGLRGVFLEGAVRVLLEKRLGEVGRWLVRKVDLAASHVWHLHIAGVDPLVNLDGCSLLRFGAHAARVGHRRRFCVDIPDLIEQLYLVRGEAVISDILETE